MVERKRRLARLFRAESLLTQAQVEERTDIDRVTLAHYESGKEVPTPEHLERLAAVARLSVEAGEELLALSDALRRPRRRAGREAGDLFEELGDTCHAHRAWRRFLSLGLPDPVPAPEDRVQAREQLDLLRALPESQRLSVVRVALDFQTWALAEQAVEASAAAVSGVDLREARVWAGLAVEVARRVRGPEAWRNRVQGYVLAQEARVLQAAGEKNAAAAAEKARKLWDAGEDPQGLLGG